MMSTAISPRFSARMDMTFQKNLTADTLLQAGLLAEVRKPLDDALAQIDDKKDPIEVDVHVSNETIKATLLTQRNGSKTIGLANNQTPQDFFQQILDAAKELATRLLSSAEAKQRKQTSMRSAMETLWVDLIASEQAQKKVQIKTTSPLSFWDSYCGNQGLINHISVNGKDYYVQKMTQGDKTEYKFATDEQFANYVGYTQISAGSKVVDMKIAHTGIQQEDWDNWTRESEESLEKVAHLAMQAQKLFNKLEELKAFTDIRF